MPWEKLQRTVALVCEWMGKRAGKKRELESLLGHLQHAAVVVRPGRTFVRRLIELLATVRGHDQWVRLNESARSDLTWWSTFMEGWNGVSMMPSTSSPVIVLETDASGSWGCGGCWGQQWFQWKWEGPSAEWLISPKELLPILLAMMVWGEYWKGQEIECRCDNMAVVAVINSGCSKELIIMHLLRCMFFVAAHFDLRLRATHIPGVTNAAADALSRNEIPRFLQVRPEADAGPTPIPAAVVDLIVREQPDWTSHRWAQLFSACCRRA